MCYITNRLCEHLSTREPLPQFRLAAVVVQWSHNVDRLPKTRHKRTGKLAPYARKMTRKAVSVRATAKPVRAKRASVAIAETYMRRLGWIK